MKAIFLNNSGTLNIKLFGDVDDSSVCQLRNQIDNTIDSENVYEVIFDFSNVDFMDSTGIGLILGRYKKLNRLNIPMYVKNTNSQVDKVFFTSGIYEIIKKIA